jgi:hypothetical protein
MEVDYWIPTKHKHVSIELNSWRLTRYKNRSHGGGFLDIKLGTKYVPMEVESCMYKTRSYGGGFLETK